MSDSELNPPVYLLLLLFLFCSPSGTGCSSEDEYLISVKSWCAIPSREPKDLENIIEWHFNKMLFMQYNSTRGNWTGYTEYGIGSAYHLNRNPGDAILRAVEKYRLCIYNAPAVYDIVEGDMAKPRVRLRSVESSSTSHPAMLACSAYDFYPRPIRVTWLRNGQEVTSDVTSTDVLANGDWSYQVQSFLEYTPSYWDTISCVVEHSTLTEPMVHIWEPSVSASESCLIAGSAILLLGAVILSAGLIHYRKKRLAGRVLVPASLPLPDIGMESPTSE